MTRLPLFLIGALCSCSALATTPTAVGLVPDEAAAIRIAVAAWVPIYGRRQIATENPFRATLLRGVWTVEGSLPPGAVGGVALAEIRQHDGHILRLTQGR